MPTEPRPHVYLLVVDRTEEFDSALCYAARLAKSNNAQIALLHVMDQEDFQYWGEIEKRMHSEYREEAESLLLEACAKVHELSGLYSVIYLEEGGRPDVILDIINKDLSITKLVLGGATQGHDPGPLVSYFTHKGLLHLRVPLTIVPGNIPDDKIKELLSF